MKKMLLATALACLLQDAQQMTHCSKQTGSDSTKGNHHHHFFVSRWAEENCPMQPKFVAAQKMLLKQKPGKHS